MFLIKKINVDQAQVDDLGKAFEEIQDKLDNLKRDMDRMRVDRRFLFEPNARFRGDRSLVYGTVASNFTVKDPRVYYFLKIYLFCFSTVFVFFFFLFRVTNKIHG